MRSYVLADGAAEPKPKAEQPKVERVTVPVEEPSKRHPFRDVLSGIVRCFVAIGCGLALAFAVRTFVAEQFVVPTGSMIPTIQEQDRILGEKITYHLRDVEVGDIIMFEDPVSDGDYLLCKRVIAVGGQTVDLVDGQVLVDGVVSPYGQGKSLPLSGDVTYPYTVPEGHLWCMGDNREHSADSREFGAVSVDSVRAKAWLIIAPQSHWANLNESRY